MSVRSGDYAQLSEHSYDREGNLAQLVNQKIVLAGVEYKILAHSDRPSGYQGTIYQRTDTNEIIVAHRGTEFGKFKTDPLEAAKDLLIADAGMVTTRTNLQTSDAISLTQQAMTLAQTQALKEGMKPPEVTVTGHSLGGTLAQITAHRFGLGGETFNAYGAASLDQRVPSGGTAVLNHVMAADFVSAASPHYGQVRVYATPAEMERLKHFGYENNRNPLDLRRPASAAVKSLGSHDMNHFLPVDGQGRPDRSVLADANARRLAADHDPMIDKYRGDIQAIRRSATLGLRGGAGLIDDAIDTLRGPLPAGHGKQPDARRQGAAMESNQSPQPDMRSPAHPANDAYRQAYAGVMEIDRAMGRTPDQASERLAASLAAESVRMHGIGQVVLSRDGSRAVALEGRDGQAMTGQRITVDVASAVGRPVEASTQAWETAATQLASERTHVEVRDNAMMRGPAMA